MIAARTAKRLNHFFIWVPSGLFGGEAILGHGCHPGCVGSFGSTVKSGSHGSGASSSKKKSRQHSSHIGLPSAAPVAIRSGCFAHHSPCHRFSGLLGITETLPQSFDFRENDLALRLLPRGDFRPIASGQRLLECSKTLLWAHGSVLSANMASTSRRASSSNA